MTVTQTQLDQLLAMAQDCLRSCGINASAVPASDNVTGDDGCDGYVDIDGVWIYPSLVGNHIGWGVGAVTVIPGRRTMSNGDPGYPDEQDFVDLMPPGVEVDSILGKFISPRGMAWAVRGAVDALMRQRLNEWIYYPEDES